MQGSSRTRPYVGRIVEDPLDRRISERAARQHAVVAVDQIVQMGLSASAVRSRVSRGRLHVVYPGVVAIVPRRLTHAQGVREGGDAGLRPGHGRFASILIDAV